MSNGTPNATAGSAGGSQHQIATMTIPFSVSAFGTTAYVPSTATLATSTTATGSTIQFGIEDSAAAGLRTATQAGTVGGTIAYQGGTAGNSLAVNSNNNYQINAGTTGNFLLTVSLTPGGASSTVDGPGQYRADLLNVNWNNTNSSTVYTPYYAGLNASNFKTPYISLQ
jgi:hypothetical protein